MTLRLLVADDNAAMRKMVGLAFAGEDAVIETASSGDAALEMLHTFHPSVVLADVSMPGYSGYEVCEIIRQDPEFATIPVILLSGAFDHLDEEEAARVEANGWLTKPFDPSEMVTMVEKLLAESERRHVPDFQGGITDSSETAASVRHFHVTPRAVESYLGQNSILEIFEGAVLNRRHSTDWHIPDELVDRVAERVAEKMFPDIETLIRRMLERT